MNKYVRMAHMEMPAETIWDVVVIGGGPAGMMAAGCAAERGARVVLLEKNTALGKKLLITGGGRCNVTNGEFDVRKFLAKFKDGGKFLSSPFSKWSSKNTIEFFNSRGMPTKTEAEHRVFPTSDTAQSVWDVLVRFMKEHKVTVLTGSPISGFVKKADHIEAVCLKNGEKISGRSFILATGGKSRPETGSTGDGFLWLKKLGHTVIEQGSALVPIAVKEPWVKQLQGVSISDIKITLFQDGQKQGVREGKILFTHFGLSGPAILNMSRDIGELLAYGNVILSLDLLPSLHHEKLNVELRDLFRKESNKKFKNVLRARIPSALVPIVVKLSKIDPNMFCHSITRQMRLGLVSLLKNIPLEVKGLLGLKKAIVTSGGVALPEVDFTTMSSRLFKNLYLVGDVLNIDRPSGGYSLQLCWTTGFVAGNSAATARS